MKKIAKFVLIGMLVCLLAIGTMLSTMMLSGASNLTPANTFVQYNGSNAVELSKTGVRTGANTWKVTLGVTNLLQQQVSTKPIEIALVIDSSSSMTMYNVEGTTKTRLAVVKEAAVQMINDLYTKATTLGLTIKVSISSFSDSTGVDQSMLLITGSGNKQTLINKINGINRSGYTNLQGGILRGVSTFYNSNFDYSITTTGSGDTRTVTATSINSSATFNDTTSTKLMVVLSDGAANRFYRSSTFNNMVGSGTDGTTYAQGAAVMAANAVKNKDITIFSIGFAYSDSTLENVASSNPIPPPSKLYYTATNAVDLSTVFETITNQIGSPALTDSMGTNLTTSSGTVTGPTGISIGNNGALLSWTPTAADLAYNHGNFISYTVTLDITNIAAGEYNNQLLNTAASFGIVINGQTCNGNFPQPTCEYDIGTLDVQFKAGTTQIANAELQQKMITDFGTPKFTVNTPPATIVYEGVTYYYNSSTYDSNAYTVPGNNQQAATVGTHNLIHNYSIHNYDVDYAYTGLVPTNAPVPPTGGTYAAGTTNISVAAVPSLVGYSFNGWNTSDVTVTSGKFTMPDKDVAFTGSWVPNTNTAYKVQYYLQNLAGTGYDLQAADTVNKTGTTGTTGTYTQSAYTGFTFEKVESNLTPKTDFTIQGDGTLIIKLYYTRNSYTVKYTYTGVVPAGVTPVKDYTVSVKYGADVTVLSASYPDTHTFSGWTPTGIGVSSGTFTMPANNVVFTGSFTQATAGYAVEHYTQNLGGGFTLANTLGASGNIGSVASYTPKSYTGFTFSSALTTSNNNFIIKADGSLVIKLYYLRNSYNVSYSYTNNPIPSGATILPLTLGYSFGAPVSVAGNATALGYSFGGWSTTDATVSSGAFTMPAKDVLLTGTFTPNSNTAYKVEHYKQTLAGTYNASADETENKTGTTDTAAAYVAKSYTGFTYNSSATTSNNTVGINFIIKADGSLVIKLYYTRNANYTYNVEYRKDSTTGTLLDSKSVSNRLWGQTYSESAISITGYTEQAPLSQNVTIDEDNKTLIFIYKANKHNVTYQLTGTIPPGFNTSVLAGLGATAVEFTTPMTRAANLSAANYNFTGWVTSDVTIGASGNYSMPDQDVVFIGSFTLMPAWVVYEYTGDVPVTATALPATNYYNLNNSVTIAPTPAAVIGFTFEGWTRNSLAASNFTVTAAGEYRIIGNWVRNSYNVTYQYDSSAPATAPAVPAQVAHPYQDNVFVDTTVGNITGYTFNGWVPTIGISATDITGGSFGMPANNIVFTGSWTTNKHNVTYQLTGTIPQGFNTSVLTTLGASGANYNTPMTVAGLLSFTNYEFHGWTSGQVTPVNGNYPMPDSDVLFTGYFTKKVFTVSYIYTGVIPSGAPALPAGGSYEIGTEVTVRTPVSMMGYTFYGWVSDGVYVSGGKFAMPNRDVVFSGWWVGVTSSVPSSEPSYYSQPSSVPSSVPSSIPSTPSSSIVTSSRPTVSIDEYQTPLDVINMGADESLTVAMLIAVFTVIMLVVLFVISKKRLRYYK